MKYYYLLIVIFIFSACEKETTEDFKLNLPELNFSNIVVNCSPYNQGIIINSDTSYKAFQDENQGYYCNNGIYPTIDFSKKALLGIQKDAGGCNIAIKYWNVYIDEIAKKYVLQAIMEGEGNCLMMISSPIWVVVPKLPSNYTVEFVEYEY